MARIPLMVQRPQRSPYVDQLAQSLMTQRPQPVYGVGGALANVLGPIAGASLAGIREAREETREEEETQQMGRLLRDAAKARAEGRDPLQAMQESGVMMPRQFMEAQLSELLKGVEPETYGQPQSVMMGDDPALVRFGNRGGQQVVEGMTPIAKAGAGTQLSKLIAERNAMAPDDPNRGLYDAAISRAALGSGMNVEVGPDGTVRLSTGVTRGPGGNIGLTSTQTSKAQGEILETADVLAGLNEVEATFNPEWLTYAGQAEQWVNALKEKAGVGLTPEQKQRAAEYQEFKASAMESASNWINRLSGAAVSEAEYDRLRGFLPTMEDSPTTFEAKLKRLSQQARLSIARYNYFLRQGIPTTEEGFRQVPLRDMRQVMDKRGNEIYQDFRAANPTMDDTQVRSMTRQALKKEFGI